MKKIKLSKSISFRFLSISLVMCIMLYLLTLVGSGMLYSRAVESRYASLCKTVSQAVSSSVDADNINIWLSDADTYGYVQATNRIEELKNDIPELEFIKIYQMRNDGMYTVYNTNSKLLRRDLGNVVGYDAKWGKYKDDFLEGKSVERIFVNGYYGQTMTYCTPMTDSNGECVAYACSGISMNSIQGELSSFIKSFGTLLFGVIAVLYAIIFIYIRGKIILPANRLGSAMLHPIRKGSVEHMRRLATNNCYTTRDMKHILKGAAKVFAEKNEITTTNQEQQKDIMYAFATIINRSDVVSDEYKDNVGASTKILCEQMMKSDKFSDTVTPEFCKSLELAAPLHDIGKLTIPDDITYKPDRLTDDEFEIIKAHSQNGALIIERAKKSMKRRKYLDIAHEAALYHHERWDGGGYPSGLKGEEIPLSARIVAIVDAYDAITRRCCYHNANTPERAYEILLGENGHFDADILECFKQARDKIIELYS